MSTIDESELKRQGFSSLTQDQFKQIMKDIERDRFMNLSAKQELKDLKRKEIVEKERELTEKEKDTLLARLKVQVEERDKDLQRIKVEYERYG